MLAKGIFLGSLLMVCVMSLPAPSGKCSLASCYRSGCIHFQSGFGDSVIASRTSELGEMMVQGLKGLGTAVPSGLAESAYKRGNYLVYFFLLPLVGLVIGLYREESRLLLAAGAISFGVVLYQGMCFAPREGLFLYATEFCVRLGNLTNATYWGVCLVLFVFAIPTAVLVDIVAFLRDVCRRKQVYDLELIVDTDADE